MDDGVGNQPSVLVAELDIQVGLPVSSFLPPTQAMAARSRWYDSMRFRERYTV